MQHYRKIRRAKKRPFTWHGSVNPQKMSTVFFALPNKKPWNQNGWMCWKKKLAPTKLPNPPFNTNHSKVNQFSASFTWKESTSHSWLLNTFNSSWIDVVFRWGINPLAKNHSPFVSPPRNCQFFRAGIPDTEAAPSLQKWSLSKGLKPAIRDLLGFLDTPSKPKRALPGATYTFAQPNQKRGIGILGSTTTATK